MMRFLDVRTFALTFHKGMFNHRITLHSCKQLRDNCNQGLSHSNPSIDHHGNQFVVKLGHLATYLDGYLFRTKILLL